MQTAETFGDGWHKCKNPSFARHASAGMQIQLPYALLRQQIQESPLAPIAGWDHFAVSAHGSWSVERRLGQ